MVRYRRPMRRALPRARLAFGGVSILGITCLSACGNSSETDLAAANQVAPTTAPPAAALAVPAATGDFNCPPGQGPRTTEGLPAQEYLKSDKASKTAEVAVDRYMATRSSSDSLKSMKFTKEAKSKTGRPADGAEFVARGADGGVKSVIHVTHDLETGSWIVTEETTCILVPSGDPGSDRADLGSPGDDG